MGKTVARFLRWVGFLTLVQIGMPVAFLALLYALRDLWINLGWWVEYAVWALVLALPVLAFRRAAKAPPRTGNPQPAPVRARVYRMRRPAPKPPGG